ncbi:MAG: hypothetical protein AABW73_04100 [Nanoarchaeota archaeon]
MLNLSNKRGEEIIFFWFFIIFLAVGVTFGATISVFNSSKTDIRLLESEILAQKVANCLIRDNALDLNLLRSKEEFMELCGLEEKIIDKSGHFYINLTITRIEDLESKKVFKNLDLGNNDLVMQCSLKEASDSDESINLGICSYRRVYVNFLTNNKKEHGVLEITTGANTKL